jgi:predicted PurR-regulated permease PerM
MLIFLIIIIIILFWGNGIIGVENNDELINQISNLTSQLNENELLIIEYKKQILDWTTKYNNLEDTYKLTKHSLNMANEALNNIDKNDFNDSNDYE